VPAFLRDAGTAVFPVGLPSVAGLPHSAASNPDPDRLTISMRTAPATAPGPHPPARPSTTAPRDNPSNTRPRYPAPPVTGNTGAMRTAVDRRAAALTGATA
jgi:hypothetical protein